MDGKTKHYGNKPGTKFMSVDLETLRSAYEDVARGSHLIKSNTLKKLVSVMAAETWQLHSILQSFDSIQSMVGFSDSHREEVAWLFAGVLLNVVAMADVCDVDLGVATVLRLQEIRKSSCQDTLSHPLQPAGARQEQQHGSNDSAIATATGVVWYGNAAGACSTQGQSYGGRSNSLCSTDSTYATHMRKPLQPTQAPMLAGQQPPPLMRPQCMHLQPSMPPAISHQPPTNYLPVRAPQSDSASRSKYPPIHATELPAGLAPPAQHCVPPAPMPARYHAPPPMQPQPQPQQMVQQPAGAAVCPQAQAQVLPGGRGAAQQVAPQTAPAPRLHAPGPGQPPHLYPHKPTPEVAGGYAAYPPTANPATHQAGAGTLCPNPNPVNAAQRMCSGGQDGPAGAAGYCAGESNAGRAMQGAMYTEPANAAAAGGPRLHSANSAPLGVPTQPAGMQAAGLQRAQTMPLPIQGLQQQPQQPVARPDLPQARAGAASAPGPPPGLPPKVPTPASAPPPTLRSAAEVAPSEPARTAAAQAAAPAGPSVTQAMVALAGLPPALISLLAKPGQASLLVEMIRSAAAAASPAYMPNAGPKGVAKPAHKPAGTGRRGRPRLHTPPASAATPADALPAGVGVSGSSLQSVQPPVTCSPLAPTRRKVSESCASTERIASKGFIDVSQLEDVPLAFMDTAALEGLEGLEGLEDVLGLGASTPNGQPTSCEPLLGAEAQNQLDEEAAVLQQLQMELEMGHLDLTQKLQGDSAQDKGEALESAGPGQSAVQPRTPALMAGTAPAHRSSRGSCGAESSGGAEEARPGLQMDEEEVGTRQLEDMFTTPRGKTAGGAEGRLGRLAVSRPTPSVANTLGSVDVVALQRAWQADASSGDDGLFWDGILGLSLPGPMSPSATSVQSPCARARAAPRQPSNVGARNGGGLSSPSRLVRSTLSALTASAQATAAGVSRTEAPPSQPPAPTPQAEMEVSGRTEVGEGEQRAGARLEDSRPLSPEDYEVMTDLGKRYDFVVDKIPLDKLYCVLGQLGISYQRLVNFLTSIGSQPRSRLGIKRDSRGADTGHSSGSQLHVPDSPGEVRESNAGSHSESGEGASPAAGNAQQQQPPSRRRRPNPIQIGGWGSEAGPAIVVLGQGSQVELQ